MNGDRIELTKDERHEIAGLLNYIEDLIVCADLRKVDPEYDEERYRDWKTPADAIEFVKRFDGADKREHCGDCTYVACTCERCMYEEWMRKVAAHVRITGEEDDAD